MTFSLSGQKQSTRSVTATIDSVDYATIDNGGTYTLALTDQQESTLPSDTVLVSVSDGVDTVSETVPNPLYTPPISGVDTTGMTKLVLPSSNVPEGAFDASDWAALVSPLASHYWDAGGTPVATVETVSGQRAFGCRLSPTPSPSTRIGAGAYLAAGQTYRTVQRVYFDPDFDWGGTNEGGKLGLGLAGGSHKSGGNAGPGDTATQTGFTSRTMWRTSGALHEYIYDADTVGYGTYVSLGVTAPRGEYFEIAREITMNSAAGVADGVLKVWYNGDIKINQSSRKWFGSGTPQIDGLIMFTFHGGDDSTWSPSRDNHVYLSEMFYASGSF